MGLPGIGVGDVLEGPRQAEGRGKIPDVTVVAAQEAAARSPAMRRRPLHPKVREKISK